MKFPLDELYHLHLTTTASVLATIIAINGSSPDKAGAQLLITADNCLGCWQNSDRQDTVTADARRQLNSTLHWWVASYPLNPVVNAKNGELTVLFQVFTTDHCPTWLNQAQQNLQKTRPMALHQRFSHAARPPESQLLLDEADASAAKDLPDGSLQLLTDIHNPLFFICHHNDGIITLVHLLGDPQPSICVIGDSDVAVSMLTQLQALPLKVIWLTGSCDSTCPTGQSLLKLPLSNESLDQLSNGTLVSIATGDHDIDVQFCARALRHPSLSFVGCLGSHKKAALIKSSLLTQGYTSQQTDTLQIPIGLPSIPGKHPSIIAASIIAQLLSSAAMPTQRI